MAQIEKSVFISYRRTNIYHARATFQDLRANGYDAFMDYETMNAGDFEQIILNQIKARAHFLVILTPSALERCAEPNDWLRREIETAIDTQRNIIPLMFDGFDWNDMQPYLTGKLALLSSYNALKIPAEYFDEAMTRLHTRFLNVAIDTVLHPTSKIDEQVVTQKLAEVVNQPTVTDNQLSASIYFERGIKYLSEQKYDNAIFNYTEAIKLDPQNADCYLYRGVAYSNDYDRALADFNESIRLNPKNEIAYNNRGHIYNKLKKYDVAIQDFNQAIILNPQLAIAYHNRGTAYYYKKEYELAKRDFDEAIKLDPQSAISFNNRGFSNFQKKDRSLAIVDFDIAVQINPNDRKLRFNRRIILFLNQISRLLRIK